MAPSHPKEKLPLDVAYTKLTDWLLERQLLRKDWPDALKAVRGQLESALGELPEGVAEIGSLIKGKRQQLHYFHCRRVMDLLEGAHEGRLKNFCESRCAIFLGDVCPTPNRSDRPRALNHIYQSTNTHPHSPRPFDPTHPHTFPSTHSTHRIR